MGPSLTAKAEAPGAQGLLCPTPTRHLRPGPPSPPSATDNSRSFLRADCRFGKLPVRNPQFLGSGFAQRPACGRAGTPPLSSVLGSGPQHWVCCTQPGDPRPRGVATALALVSGRRNPLASILSPIPSRSASSPHSAPCSPGDKGTSTWRRPSATSSLYSRQGCEGAEGRGHMTGTPLPPPRGPLLSPHLRQFPLLSLHQAGTSCERGAWGEGGQVRGAQLSLPRCALGGGRPFRAGCGTLIGRAGLGPLLRLLPPSPQGPHGGCSEPRVPGPAPFLRPERDPAGLRAAGPWPFISGLPVALAPLGGRDSNCMGGSHHIRLSYFLTSRLGLTKAQA